MVRIYRCPACAARFLSQEGLAEHCTFDCEASEEMADEVGSVGPDDVKPEWTNDISGARD